MAKDLPARKHSRHEANHSGSEPVRSEATIRSVDAADNGAHRREHARFSVDLDVTIGSDHNFYAGFAENLSAGGVFIATHNVKPVGSKVEVSINLPSGAQVQAAGEVRWIRVFNEQSDMPPGMGVRFEQLEPSAEDAIQNFLSQRDPLFFDDD